MNRSQFLAIIPSLGALPFLGKDIIKEDKRIIIEQPKQIEVVQNIPSLDEYDKSRFQLLAVYDGKVIGSASMREIGMSRGIIEEACLSMDAIRTINPRLEIKCSFDDKEMCGHLYRALRS